MNYKEYEKEVARISKQNEVYLERFTDYLVDQGLTKKTIRNHVSNIELYLNDYLCYEEPMSMVEGCYHISGLLGDWFIRKAMWANVAAIKGNIASIKKFYKVMLADGLIVEDDYKYLCTIIKEEKDSWFEQMEEFDNCDFQF